VKLRIGNISTYVDANETELDWLCQYLRWQDPKAKHSPLVKSGQWDGTHSVFDRGGQTFPAGLSKIVLRGAAKSGLRVDLEDGRIPPNVPLRPLPEGWLRDYQTEAFNAALSPTSPVPTGIPGRGIVHCATGGGKSRIAASIAWCVPIQWLFLVNSQDLLDQMAKNFTTLTGEPSGRIGDGEWSPARFTVATVQTLHQRRKAATKLLSECQGVIVDEAHTSASGTFQAVLDKMPNAFYRLGLSATPLGRADKADLLTVGAIGPVIYRADAQDLQAKGVLAGADITFLTYPEQPRSYWAKVQALMRHDQRRAYQLAYDIGVVKNQARNHAVVEAVKASPKPCLTFVKLVSHGHDLKKQMTRAGLKVDFVSGQENSYERKDAIKRLVYGELDVLLSSAVFYQGVDIPELLSLVNAAGGLSDTQSIQRLGRGTRKVEGKDKVLLFDFLDSGPFLKRHAEARKKTYERSGYVVSVR
jgi:superfamily II DNA or RNA helicase